MEETFVRRALQLYEVTPRRILPVQSGYRNRIYAVETEAGAWRNLMLFKRAPDTLARIRRSDAVANYAAGSSLPVRVRADERLLRLGNERLAGLYHYLPGRTIPWEAYTMEHLKLLGQTMSQLHGALADCPTADLPAVTDEYQAILKRMRRYLAEPGVQTALAAKLGLAVDDAVVARLNQFVWLTAQLQPVQALHMDFVRGNVLFDGSGSRLVVSGVLDFEKTARGHVLYDIARTLAFLLVDAKHRPSDRVRKYFMHSGYNKRGPAAWQPIKLRYQSQTYDVLEQLVDLFLLYDFYKFLRHNPYQFLTQNEHYVRTVRRLLERGQIRMV